MSLSKKEAFQMILAKIFNDKEEITSEFIDSTFDKIIENKPNNGIIKKLEDKIHQKEDKQETPNNTFKIPVDEKENKDETKEKKRNVNRYIEPGDEYIFPDAYKTDKDLIFTDDGFFGFKGNKLRFRSKYSGCEVFEVFFNTDYPFLKKYYNNIRDLDTYISLPNKMKIAYRVLQNLKNGGGETLEAIREGLGRYYKVPLSLTFSSANGTLFINGKDTYISLEDVEKYTNRVNDSMQPYDEIVLIMNEAKQIKNKKYLYYILNNSGNSHIQEILKNTVLQYDEYGQLQNI